MNPVCCYDLELHNLVCSDASWFIPACVLLCLFCNGNWAGLVAHYSFVLSLQYCAFTLCAECIYILMLHTYFYVPVTMSLFKTLFIHTPRLSLAFICAPWTCSLSWLEPPMTYLYCFGKYQASSPRLTITQWAFLWTKAQCHWPVPALGLWPSVCTFRLVFVKLVQLNSKCEISRPVWTSYLEIPVKQLPNDCEIRSRINSPFTFSWW